MIGTKLGPYEITSAIGAGGMGEVYRATDTKLERDVAIKVLPATFVEDKERLVRFEREAKLLAQLHHPTIASIFGLEESGESPALVMELVEGPTLAERLADGPIPVDEALPIARQIAEALEYAHEHGVIHRDLKPANIKLTGEDQVKVLDFGLAKAMDTEGSQSSGASLDLSHSPTMTLGATVQGMILGTAGYMAPEQAAGKPVDKRADIWAFGVVLYEMLTGAKLFEGDSVPETLAGVLKGEIDLEKLPEETPRTIRRLLARCLERNPKHRLRDIGDARYDLAEGEAGNEPGASRSASHEEGRPWYRRPLTLGLAGLAVIAVASLAVAVWALTARSAPTEPPTHLSIALPYGHSLVSGPAISRDGRTVAFVSTDGIAQPQLYVRRLDEPTSHLIPGTEDADQPFFSPDGRWLAYYAKGGLFKVSLEGGAPVRLADSGSHKGGTWLDDGRIVFNRSWNGGLYAVSQDGGNATLLIKPTPPNEYAEVWPYALPGSHTLLFSSWGDTFHIDRLDLGTMKATPLLRDAWRRAEYVAPGTIVYGGQGELLAAPYAPGGSVNGSTAVVEHVDPGSMSGDARFDISQNGTLAYVSANRNHRLLSVVDMLGRATPTRAPEDGYSDLRLSPDGRRAAVIEGGKLMIIDLDRGTATPLVPELQSKGARGSPVWSPDGSRVVFASNHEGNWDIYAKAASGVDGIESVVQRPADQYPDAYAPDGTLLFEEVQPDTGLGLWMLPPGGKPKPWLVTPAEEGEARFSPDGRLVAYASNASGRFEVYLQTRAAGGQRIQISVDGGEHPEWAPAGDRLYFRQGNAMMTATIDTRHGLAGLAAGVPEKLFNGGWELAGNSDFAVMPDGKHFLMIQRKPDAIPTRIDVVLNWFQDLHKRLQAK